MTVEDIREHAARARKFSPRTPPPPFKVLPFGDLAHTDPAPPAFWWDGYMPAGEVTLFGAHGGTGKSLIALMLAVSLALGQPLFGVPTRRAVVVFYSAEDTPETVRFRLHKICRLLAVDIASLEGRLHILDATSCDPVLFHEVSARGQRTGATTPTYAALVEYFESVAGDVLVIDNASDVFDGNEIARAMVRAFMRSLVQIARPRGGGVLLLAHVDKLTARGQASGTDAYSGSTAWHNSARSRLYLARGLDGGLSIEHQKSNHGRQRDPLSLIWPEDGLPQVDAPASGFVHHLVASVDAKALLKLIGEAYGRGEYVATDPRSRYHAAAVLGALPTFPKRRSRAEVFAMLREAESRGFLTREIYRDRNRKAHERWALTNSGCAHVGIAAPCAPCAPCS